LSTLLTVPAETPASRATSRIVAMRYRLALFEQWFIER
jgi:hypothetical protein